MPWPVGRGRTDGTSKTAELRLLEGIRYELDLDRLHAAAMNAVHRGAPM